MASRLTSGGLGRGPQPASDKAKKDPKDCVTFEPQQWRATVCKNCFRMKSQHPVSKAPAVPLSDPEASAVAAGASSPKEQKKKIPSPGSLKKLERTGSAGRNSPSASTVRAKKAEREAALKRASSREKLDDGRRGSKETSPPVLLSRSGSAKSRSRSQSKDRSGSSTPTPRANLGLEDEKYVEELENDLFEMEDRYESAKKERDELDNELDSKMSQLEIVECQITEYKNKIAVLEKRCQHLEDEVKSYRERLQLPESEQSVGDGGVTSTCSAAMTAMTEENVELRSRMEQAEELCQELMEENDCLKEELDELKREVEEMHDNFQDEDAETMRELQKEVDSATKTCRILQFKLRKAERRFDQCEAERSDLEERLRRLEDQLYGSGEREQLRGIEAELHMAKEVSVRLHDELEFVEEKRLRVEEESRRLKEELEVSERDRIRLQNEADRSKIEMDKLRALNAKAGGVAAAPPSPSGTEKSSTLQKPRLAQTREPSFEEEQIHRDLEATREREADLVEQLRFAHEEARVLKRKLNETEEENDSLTLRMEKLAQTKLRLGSDSSEPDDDPAEASHRLQIDLLEQEASLLRKRVVTLERENEVLNGDLRLVTTQMSELRASSPTPGGGGAAKPSIRGTQLTTEKGDSEKVPLTERIRQLQEKVLPLSLVPPKEKKTQEQLSAALGKTRELESELTQMKMQMQTVEGERDALKKETENLVKRTNKSKTARDEKNLETATRVELMKQIDELEEEIEDLMLLIKKNDLRVDQLEQEMSRRERESDEQREAFIDKERELGIVIDELLQKNSVMSDLLEIVTNARAAESDAESSDGEGSWPHRSTSNMSALSGVSTGSDEVFQRERSGSEPLKTQRDKKQWEEKFCERLRCLEQLLMEERRRAQMAERKLEQAMEGGRGRTSSDGSGAATRAEKELLKRELEERERELEERDSQINDLHNKLDQSRRMYDAMKMLLDEEEKEKDKEDGHMTSRMAGRSASDREIYKGGKAAAEAAAANSTPAEVAALHRDMHRMTLDLNKMEVERNRLLKDRQILEEELKIREDHIFEQDDLVRKLQRQISDNNREMERSREELKSLREVTDAADADSVFDTVKETPPAAPASSVAGADTELETLKTEMSDLQTQLAMKEKTLHEAKRKLSEKNNECSESEEKLKLLNESVRTRDDRIKEKDDLISTINQRLANREKEITDMDNLLKQTTSKLTKAENEIKQFKLKISDQEKDLKTLHNKIEELSVQSKKQTEEIEAMKKGNEKREKELQKTTKDKEKELEEVTKQRDYLHKMKNPPNLVNLQKEVDKLRKENSRLTVEVNSVEDKNSVEKSPNSEKNQDTLSLKETKEALDPRMKVKMKHLEQVERLFNTLTSTQVTLKLQIEAYQRDLEEYKHLYYQLKTKYEKDELSWSREKCKLLTIGKEQEDKSIVISNLRKSLQDARLTIAELEHRAFEQDQEFTATKTKFDRDVSDLQNKLSQYEETHKMPKVLQRFAGKKTLQAENVNDRDKQELRVRLSDNEAKVSRMRKDLLETERRATEERRRLLTDADEERTRLEKELDLLRKSSAEVTELQRQCDSLRSKLRSSEEQHERARRIWQEERMTLQYGGEECRLLLDQWLDRLHNSVDEFEHSRGRKEDLQELTLATQLLVDEITLYKQKLREYPGKPRRTSNTTGSGDQSAPDSMSGSFNNGHGTIGGLGNASSGSVAALSTAHSRRSRSVTPSSSQMGPRTASLDWTARGLLRSESPFRSTKRAESSEREIKKITNFPDPTLGFMVPSRNTSTESLQSLADDYTNRSYTTPPTKTQSRNQAAKSSFLQSYDKSIYGSQDQLANKLEEVEHKKSTPPSIASINSSVNFGRSVSVTGTTSITDFHSSSTASSVPKTSSASLSTKPSKPSEPSNISPKTSTASEPSKGSKSTTATSANIAKPGPKTSKESAKASTSSKTEPSKELNSAKTEGAKSASSTAKSDDSTKKRGIFGSLRSTSVDTGSKTAPTGLPTSKSAISKPSNPFQVQLRSVKDAKPSSSSDSRPKSVTSLKNVFSAKK